MKFKKYIDRVLDLAVASILGAMSLVVAANVFSRFVLHASIYWGDELTLILFVWLTFLGAAVGIRDRAHYVFGYFTEKLSGKKLRYYSLAGDIFTLIATCVLLYFSSQVAIKINVWIMPATEVSRALVYGATPVGCIFILYYLGFRLFGHTHVDEKPNTP